MEWDDLEPIDLEPIDPGADRDARFDRDRPKERSAARIWIAVGAVGVFAWAGFALTRPTGRHSTIPPVPPSVPPPAAIATTVVQRIDELAPRLWAGLRGVGSGRFAVVVDDRLYLLDRASTEAQTTLVPLPEGHVTIDVQNDSSLLASTFQQTLVSTAPVGTRVLSVRDGAFPSTDAARWWLGRNDGTLRNDLTGAVVRVPPGLRVFAAVRQGFVALDSQSRWIVWSNAGSTPIAPAGGRLLAAGPHAIAIQYGCGGSCPVDVVDTEKGTSGTFDLPPGPTFAAFSPDGSRLAVTSTNGSVFLLDPSTRRKIVEVADPHPLTPSPPLAWTADSRTLLVVRANQIDIMRASDGAVVGSVAATVGLEQLIALP